MKFFTALIGAISLLPMSAIASPEPLNMPLCYMIRPNGRVVNLSYMCSGTANASTSSNQFAVTADLVCKAFASDVLTARSQFAKDKANEGLRYCLQNKDSIQQEINAGK